jgi:integration host factor subunit alpha
MMIWKVLRIVAYAPDHCGLSKQTSKALVQTLFELIKKALESGDDVLISGFGKVSARKKAPLRGRNPATGRICPLMPGRWLASGILKEKINGGVGRVAEGVG